MTFQTIYISNIPLDCHIRKGRLESDGISAFIYDENIVWVHPFRAVAIGGVKLKVPEEQSEIARAILDSIADNKLIDQDGYYEVSEALDKVMERQNEILRLKSQIRRDTSLLKKDNHIKSNILSQEEIDTLISEEKEFNKIAQKSFTVTWKEFWAQLLDFEGRIFEYLRPRSVDYYLEKEMVELYVKKSPDTIQHECPRCNSDNVSFGYAIDYKWDILYLILSFLIYVPFPLIRKKYHCFNCGFDFKIKNKKATPNK